MTNCAKRGSSRLKNAPASGRTNSFWFVCPHCVGSWPYLTVTDLVAKRHKLSDFIQVTENRLAEASLRTDDTFAPWLKSCNKTCTVSRAANRNGSWLGSVVLSQSIGGAYDILRVVLSDTTSRPTPSPDAGVDVVKITGNPTDAAQLGKPSRTACGWFKETNRLFCYYEFDIDQSFLDAMLNGKMLVIYGTIGSTGNLFNVAISFNNLRSALKAPAADKETSKRLNMPRCRRNGWQRHH